MKEVTWKVELVNTSGMNNERIEAFKDSELLKVYYGFRRCYSADIDNFIDNEYTEELLTNGKLSTESREKVEKFIRRMLKTPHETPIEHVNLTFHVSRMSRNCYSSDTEILTKRGWKLFPELEKDDEFATRSWDGYLEWHKAYEFISYKHEGKMVHFKSRGGVDLLVTPDHKVFSAAYESNYPEFKLTPAFQFLKPGIGNQKMTKQIKVRNSVSDTFIIPGFTYWKANKKCDLPDLEFNKDIFFKFLAWYLSEGSVWFNEKENSYRIAIPQLDKGDKNIQNRKEIIELISALGFTATETNRDISFKNRQLGYWLSNLGVSYNKYIPFDIFSEFDQYYANLFVETYSKADASVDNTGHIKFYTTSKALADQLQLIIFISGKSANIWEDNRVNQSHFCEKGNCTITHKHICYVVSIHNKCTDVFLSAYRGHFQNVNHYNDFVYCVNVPNHVVFIRRNGIPIWCGNCSHQWVRSRVASHNQQSMRYVQFDNVEVVVPPSIKMDPYALDAFISAVETTEQTYLYLVNDRNIPAEDARYILPNAAATSIVTTMNLRELLHFFRERCCNRSQWEIRNISNQMLDICKELFPSIFENAGAKCMRLRKCPETDTCGEKPFLKLLNNK